MIIILTEHGTSNAISIQAQVILFTKRQPVEVDRRDKSIIAANAGVIEATLVVTGIQGPGGKLQSFTVKEDPIEIARRQNACMKCDVAPVTLGFPPETPVPTPSLIAK
jgi:hypothetical protein